MIIYTNYKLVLKNTQKNFAYGVKIGKKPNLLICGPQRSANLKSRPQLVRVRRSARTAVRVRKRTSLERDTEVCDLELAGFFAQVRSLLTSLSFFNKTL